MSIPVLAWACRGVRPCVAHRGGPVKPRPTDTLDRPPTVCRGSSCTPQHARPGEKQCVGQHGLEGMIFEVAQG